jgi:hypothetical protein
MNVDVTLSSIFVELFDFLNINKFFAFFDIVVVIRLYVV